MAASHECLCQRRFVAWGRLLQPQDYVVRVETFSFFGAIRCGPFNGRGGAVSGGQVARDTRRPRLGESQGHVCVGSM